MRILETANPLIPTAYDLVWSTVALAVVALAVVALVSIWRSRAALTGTQTLVWTLLVVFVPAFGAIAWFLAGHPRAQRSRG